MHVSELNRAVAEVTGESIATIRQLGFSLLEEPSFDTDDEMGFGPNVVDWDELDSFRAQQLLGSECHEPKAA